MSAAGRGRGFTYIELMVALALLALLAVAVAEPLRSARQRADERELRAALRDIRTALDAFKRLADEGRAGDAAAPSGYPRSLAALSAGIRDPRQPQSPPVYLLRRIPPDPMYRGAPVPAELTWGLRSYASPATAPAAGADVFDVYSRSTALALDGSRYRDW